MSANGSVYTSFGYSPQDIFVLSYVNSDYLYYYKYKSMAFKLIWKKPIPENEKFYSRSFISSKGEIFLQSFYDYVRVYDQELRLIRTLPAPGMIHGILHGGQYAVVDNLASHFVSKKLSVVSTLNLGKTHHHLDVPPGGVYDRNDMLGACGHHESRVAVVSSKKPYVDIYDQAGELYTIYTHAWFGVQGLQSGRAVLVSKHWCGLISSRNLSHNIICCGFFRIIISMN